jgi:hypothetical protein
MGQSNIAAGATIGSNHNSRGADGEIIMGRGFWPGLCVSLKHNSKFASFSILSKGDYPAELNIPIPFSLIGNDITNDRLTIMPGYWFLYNMYALARNSWKYVDRDKRTERIQNIEYDYLAPDTINEMFVSMELMELWTGKAYLKTEKEKSPFSESHQAGKHLLKSGNKIVNELEILGEHIENSKRKVKLLKVLPAYKIFENLITYYGIIQILQFIKEKGFTSLEELKANIPAKPIRNEWLNIGGQLMPSDEVTILKEKISTGKIKSWDTIHEYFQQQGDKYQQQKFKHALASLVEITGINIKKIDAQQFGTLLNEVVATKEWMTKGIYDSRAKDYTNPYRKMVYESVGEMTEVVGKLEENGFIKTQIEELKSFKSEITSLKKKFKIK